MKFSKLSGGVGFLKAGFLGFNKSGKTYTSALLAIGLRKKLKLKGPIAMLETEAAAQYIAPMIERETGKELLGIQTRALGTAVEFLQECENQNISVAIVDSVTHLWRELCNSYQRQKNEALRRKGRPEKNRLEFQDWNPIKAEWARFSDLYLNSKLHVIICGRAGYEWDFEAREDGSGKDLVKTGIKMKTETEFGFEPSLLVEMERVQCENGKAGAKITHRATVIGDRFAVIDGKTVDNPTFDFFVPYVDMLTPGSHASVDTHAETDMGIDEEGDSEFFAERKRRKIQAEEIQGLLVAAYPGQSAIDKKAKLDLMQQAFGTRSWSAIESMQSQEQATGLEKLPNLIVKYQKKQQKIGKTKGGAK